MLNIDYILQQMSQVVLSAHKYPPDIQADTVIEFADDQKCLRTGTIYIVDCADAEAVLKNTYIEPGACLFVANSEQAGAVISLAPCERLTVIETVCSVGALYNKLTKAMRRCFRQGDDSFTVQEKDDWEVKIQNLWHKILNRGLVGHVEIKDQINEICPNAKDYLRLAIIVPNERFFPDDWFMPLDELRKLMPESYLFLNKGVETREIIVFQFFDRQTFGTIENEEAVRMLLKEHKLCMMLSNSTRDCGKIGTLYSLTRRAGLVAMRLDLERDQVIYPFERYGMYSVIDMCSQRFMTLFNHSDIIYLVHPIVVHLTRYDEKHNTNLRDVLFYYLQNSQDLKRTAEVLYMHRNTVANKMNQIRSICDIDFEDGGLCQRLLFSCQVILYYERVLRQRLSRNDSEREMQSH